MLSNLLPGQGLGGNPSRLLGLGGGWVTQVREAARNLVCRAASFNFAGEAQYFAGRAKSAIYNLFGGE